MRKGYAVVVCAALVLGSSTSVLAQGRGGNGGGGNGNGGDSENTPLIIVFRDAEGDLLRSDGGAYIDGDPNIEEAILDPHGGVWLGLLGGKKGIPEGARMFTVEVPEVDPAYAALSDPLYEGRSGVDPAPEFLLESGGVQVGGGHISAFGVDGDGVRTDDDVAGETETSWTTFSVFFDEPESRNSWKLSYGSNTFDGPLSSSGIPNWEGEGYPLVHCIDSSNSSYPCVAWVVEKESPAKQVLDHAGLWEQNRVALLPVSGRGSDAGEYIMPFAFGICVKAHIESMYGPGVTFAQLEQGCRTVLATHYGFPSP